MQMHKWIEKSYDDFKDGQFGNGGQNIYVSKSGILQRIFHFDMNKDGWTDLVFVNSQDMNERPPVYVYSDLFGDRTLEELEAMGSYRGEVCDLNNDGYDDLIIANQNNGTHSDITAYIYFGSPQGLTNRYKLELPAPNSRAVAAGDFNGDGIIELAFCSDHKLRIFSQDERGFVAGKYDDFEIDAQNICAGDIDGDGFADLYVKMVDGSVKVFWGGEDGINVTRALSLSQSDIKTEAGVTTTAGWLSSETEWIPKILRLNEQTYLFMPEQNKVLLYPVYPDKMIGQALTFECGYALSASTGDINSDGTDDLVFAVCKDREVPAVSVVYWGSKDGFNENNKTLFETLSARDVLVCDLTGDGYSDVIICQGRTNIMNTTESLVFKGSKDGVCPDPVRLVTHDATMVLAGKTRKGNDKQLIFINHVGGRVRGDMPVYIYYGSENGFSEDNRAELPGWAAPNANCCDLNDDGWADLLVCNCSENAPHLDPGSFIYWGSSDGFDPLDMTILPTTRAHGSAVGDFRHSGYLDIAVTGFYNAELLIFSGTENGFDTQNPQRIILDPELSQYSPYRSSDPEFWKNKNDPSSGEFNEPRWLLAADLNKDGWLDLFVSQCCGQKCRILWGGPQGFSLDNSTEIYAEGGICAQAADLNGNGWLDLVIAGHQCVSKNYRFESYVYIYWGGPEGFREDRRTQLPAHTCNSISIADFNNDGILDIFATSYNSGRDRDVDSYIYWGSPGGNYSQYNRTRLFTHSACGSIAADFNGDGWVDIAVANHKTYGDHVGLSQVFWNGPGGFSEKNVTLLPTLGPHGMLPAEPANILDRSCEEFYISSSFKLPENMTAKGISYIAEIPEKTWIRSDLRFAQEEDGLSESEWIPVSEGACSPRYAGCWMQYRLALGAVNGGSTPRISEVIVEYE